MLTTRKLILMLLYDDTTGRKLRTARALAELLRMTDVRLSNVRNGHGKPVSPEEAARIGALAGLTAHLLPSGVVVYEQPKTPSPSPTESMA